MWVQFPVVYLSAAALVGAILGALIDGWPWLLWSLGLALPIATLWLREMDLESRVFRPPWGVGGLDFLGRMPPREVEDLLANFEKDDAW